MEEKDQVDGEEGPGWRKRTRMEEKDQDDGGEGPGWRKRTRRTVSKRS